MRQGHDLPDKILNAPEILPGQEVYFETFFDLCTTRQMNGMGGMGEISNLDLRTYCTIRGFSESLTNDMLYYIPRMDMAYLEAMAKKIKRNGG